MSSKLEKFLNGEYGEIYQTNIASEIKERVAKRKQLKESMNNNQIPTAEEFLNRDESGVFNKVDITQAMIEFAKLHVTAALQAASKNAQPTYDEGGILGFVDKETVLDAYPLTNIK